MRERWRKYEDNFLRKNYCKMVNREMGEALGRTLPSVDNRMHKLKLRRPKEIAEAMSTATRFKKGHTSWNKGKKGVRYSPETEFKKGNLPHNTLHNGCIVVRKNCKRGTSYKWIRISKANWELFHRVVWEKANGPIAKDKILRFIDGNALNVVLENLELVTRNAQVRDNYNPVKAGETMKAQWASGKRYESDKYIASLLFLKDKNMRAEALKKPELLELKRNQLKLNRELKYGT